MARRILVTSALPYANGPIHIGHLVEYIQTDIWVRFQKLQGNDCRYFCADDTHGTAIMISAQKNGVTEEQFIAKMSEEHQQDFAGFGIEFDNYGSTHSDENRVLCGEFWQSLRAADLVVEKDVHQLYDPEAKTFLADRFVRGTCPKCHSENQPGDNCSKCGAAYTPAELINPKSTLSSATPELKTHPHLFVKLEKLHSFLDEWTQSGTHLQEEVANYLKGQFLQNPKEKELKDWDISRPSPYFGFEIPDSPGDYWYVWFDAPIGYIASTQQWCDKNGEDLAKWWKNPETEIHHFIGKDITYFHTLFWPGMLKTACYNLPTKVHIHGFLTVDGKKMSKSDGTFIKAATYLKHLDPAYVRYYYATKLGPRLDDLDLNVKEFVDKVDADLRGKVVNLASRAAKFVEKTGLSETYPDDGGLFERGAKAGAEIAKAYEDCDLNKAMRLILELADAANPYIEANKPWELRKDPANAQKLQDVCTVGINLFRQIIVYLTPVLPKLAADTGALLNDPITSWEQSQTPLTGTAVNKFQHLIQRVEPDKVQAMIDDSKEEAAAEAPATESQADTTAAKFEDSGQPLIDEPMTEECTIDDFVKVDLRVARVLSAEEVPDARKLLKLTLGLGGDARKQVFAGIKAAYKPEELVGRLVIMVANLKPRQMKFGLSEGMVCASGPGGEEVFLLSPDDGAKPGQRIH